MKQDNKIIFYTCACYGEGIILEYQENEPQADLSFWQRGFDDKKFSWKNRFRIIWKILTTGLPYNDMIILTKAEASKLGTDLLTFALKPEKE